MSAHSFVQIFWPNYSSICLDTKCSSFPPLEECFKNKTNRTNLIHLLLCFKIGSSPKMTENGYSLSMVGLYTVGKKIQKVKKKLTSPTHFLPLPKTAPGPLNDQKAVFSKYVHVIYCWKGNGKEISKSLKFSPAPPKNWSQAPKYIKTGAP